jgi:hypothetical protein
MHGWPWRLLRQLTSPPCPVRTQQHAGKSCSVMVHAASMCCDRQGQTCSVARWAVAAVAPPGIAPCTRRVPLPDPDTLPHPSPAATLNFPASLNGAYTCSNKSP